ncbi:MAG: hypothetical protein EBX40_05070 [Gammaproteobacteria bacterium]|nr:hypothetical protein [Gammaproteobacteria bacterium]
MSLITWGRHHDTFLRWVSIRPGRQFKVGCKRGEGNSLGDGKGGALDHCLPKIIHLPISKSFAFDMAERRGAA